MTYGVEVQGLTSKASDAPFPSSSFDPEAAVPRVPGPGEKGLTGFRATREDRRDRGRGLPNLTGFPLPFSGRSREHRITRALAFNGARASAWGESPEPQSQPSQVSNSQGRWKRSSARAEKTSGSELPTESVSGQRNPGGKIPEARGNSRDSKRGKAVSEGGRRPRGESCKGRRKGQSHHPGRDHPCDGVGGGKRWAARQVCWTAPSPTAPAQGRKLVEHQLSLFQWGQGYKP
ncbi:uncharacterized protein LOC124994147 [Sciurus carolinensis]|uniref:uncharacterized protein LOC124994147 n=1 Tax=Sciurus carolinensis TaxID=30640 RepID=UPI001FB22320|nr:uncharacterized protein LOC124994147 [Sciurus carolinensis]